MFDEWDWSEIGSGVTLPQGACDVPECGAPISEGGKFCAKDIMGGRIGFAFPAGVTFMGKAGDSWM